MASAEFTIPEHAYEAEQAADFSARLDAQQYTPETQPNVFASFEEISNHFETFRNNAAPLEENRRPWLKAVKSIVITPKPVRTELIEKESIFLGKLVKKQDPNHENRIWIQGGDLFYGYIDASKKISLNDTAIHYQFDNGEPQKSTHGHVMPFVEGEVETLKQLIPLLEPTVLELYPAEKARLKSDFDLTA